MLSSFLDNPPIRKVIVGAVVAGVLYVCHHVLHVAVAPDEIRAAVEAALPIVAAYLTPDPRVN